MLHERAFWKLDAIARDRGLAPVVWARAAAEMLAVSGLYRRAGTDSPLRDAELTAQAWEGIRREAEILWRAERDAAGEWAQSAVSPFKAALNSKNVGPGDFEVLRQAVVLESVTRMVLDGADAMFNACLSLVETVASSHLELSPGPGISRLIADLANVSAHERVFCAFSGAAEPGLRVARSGAEVLLALPSVEAASFWASISAAVGVQMWVICTPPFEDLYREWFDISAAFDAAIVAPPFNVKVAFSGPAGSGQPPTSSEAWGVALAALRARRRAICLLPNSFLFRATLQEQSFKDKTIRRYGLQTVIALPPGALNQTAIASAVLVLDPGTPVSDVLMVDFSKGKKGRTALNDQDAMQIIATVARRESAGSSRLVGFDELASEQFNFTPERYLLAERDVRLRKLLQESPTATLDELVEIYRPQAAPAAEEGLLDPQTDAPRELSVADLDEVGLARRPTKPLPVRTNDYYKLRKAELRAGDVLLVTKGSVGRVGYVGDIPDDELWVANQSFAILRLRRNAPLVDSRVLFRFLSSSAGQAQIQQLRVGATIPSLQMGDIRRLTILMPSPEEQYRIAREVEDLFDLQAKINSLRDQLRERQLSIWPDTQLASEV